LSGALIEVGAVDVIGDGAEEELLGSGPEQQHSANASTAR
jgi:hypothetical protein